MESHGAPVGTAFFDVEADGAAPMGYGSKGIPSGAQPNSVLFFNPDATLAVLVTEIPSEAEVTLSTEPETEAAPTVPTTPDVDNVAPEAHTP